MTSLLCEFRSAPTCGVGDVEFLQVGWHQGWMAQSVTIIHPCTMHGSAKPPFFCNACCAGRWLRCAFSGPPSWMLAVSCSLTACSACKRWNSEGSVNTNRWKAACRLLSSHASLRFRCQHSQSQAALWGSINISLLCSTHVPWALAGASSSST